MFDKVIILDQGGYMAYFGNPVESVIYFKTLDAQINSSLGECPSCGNVNPETIFNIIDIQVVDEFGRYTEKRRVKPSEWGNSFTNNHPFSPLPEIKDPPHKNLERPSLFRQFEIYLSRDFRSKIANKQYLLLTLLEAPVLGFILSFIIRYIPDPTADVYVFYENENIPIYIFMSLIVSLFLGLTISAEEIYRDRKILKRERFLSLSRHSYLSSKVVILICISAIQVLLFLAIANPILEIKGLFFRYFLALFTTAFCANMIGLNISASFNSAITIYIVIPLIIIPMMVLSGAMFSFDKLNRKIGSVDKVPVIAELIPTRWTYEALMVTQFKDNKYSQFRKSQFERCIYDIEKDKSQSNYYLFLIDTKLFPALEMVDSIYHNALQSKADSKKAPRIDNTRISGELTLLKNELTKLTIKFHAPPYKNLNDLTTEKYNPEVYKTMINYLKYLQTSFNQFWNKANNESDDFRRNNKNEKDELLISYSNEKLKEIVTKEYERARSKILKYKNNYIQNYDPIYLNPDKRGFLSFRTHFFAPSKYIFGILTDTFTFNITIVLLSTIFLYLLLYYELLARVVRFFENIRIRKLLFNRWLP
jgi:hypothetical protein